MESTLGTTSAIIDGEIVCLDSDGRSVFNELLFHHKESYFFAFDLPWLNGRDLRSRPLIERKQHLRRLIPEQSNRLLYCDHVDENGEGLFELACQHDLEGIVAKKKDSRYTCNRQESNWLKIRNRNYSQVMGRDELFDGRSARDKNVASDGWAGCALACQMASDFNGPASPNPERNNSTMTLSMRLVIQLS